MKKFQIFIAIMLLMCTSAAAQSEGFELRNRDVIAITESITFFRDRSGNFGIMRNAIRIADSRILCTMSRNADLRF